MPPTVGEVFVWMAAEPGKWGEQLETITEVQEEGPPGYWLVQYNDGWEYMHSVVTRDVRGRWVRAD